MSESSRESASRSAGSDFNLPNAITATRIAVAPLIAYLDDDNAWHPTHLEELVQARTAELSRAVEAREAGTTISKRRSPFSRARLAPVRRSTG